MKTLWLSYCTVMDLTKPGAAFPSAVCHFQPHQISPILTRYDIANRTRDINVHVSEETRIMPSVLQHFRRKAQWMPLKLQNITDRSYETVLKGRPAKIILHALHLLKEKLSNHQYSPSSRLWQDSPWWMMIDIIIDINTKLVESGSNYSGLKRCLRQGTLGRSSEDGHANFMSSYWIYRCYLNLSFIRWFITAQVCGI